VPKPPSRRTTDFIQGFIFSDITQRTHKTEKMSIARQALGKHVPAATNAQATIEVLLETMCFIQSVQSGYNRI
jgi:hypothetical protein